LELGDWRVRVDSYMEVLKVAKRDEPFWAQPVVTGGGHVGKYLRGANQVLNPHRESTIERIEEAHSKES
jgi:hypothetical protein